MGNKNLRPMDDRPYTERDFEEMFERLDKLSEQYAKEKAERK